MRRIARPSFSAMETLTSQKRHQSVLRIGLCQVLVSREKETSYKSAERAIARAVKDGAQLVVLPECWNCPYDTKEFRAYGEHVEDGPSVQKLKHWAQQYDITLVGGSIPTIDKDNKVYNTSITFNNKGEQVAVHHKVHLFDIDVPGGIRFQESETLSAGNQVTCFQVSPDIKAGVAICYDIRFPELSMKMAKEGCNLLIFPGAFNMTTGPAHWELLARARALDNQLFVATCSPARDPTASYTAWGHSSVIDPWGTVIATTQHEEDVVVVDMDFERVKTTRQAIPISTQKQTKVYGMIWE